MFIPPDYIGTRGTVTPKLLESNTWEASNRAAFAIVAAAGTGVIGRARLIVDLGKAVKVHPDGWMWSRGVTARFLWLYASLQYARFYPDYWYRNKSQRL
jgi:hypothetical protein